MSTTIGRAQVPIIILNGTNWIDYRVLNTNFWWLNYGIGSNAAAIGTPAPTTNGPWARQSNDWIQVSIVGQEGPQGPQGSNGPAGAQGPAGTNGATGPQGSTGPTGAQGVAGQTGPSGPQSPLTNNLNAAGFSITNATNMTTHSFAVSGGSPTNWAILQSTNTAGNSTWKLRVTKRHAFETSATNTLPLTVSTVGFRPSGAVVFAGVENPVAANYLLSYGTIDATSQSCVSMWSGKYADDSALAAYCAKVFIDDGHAWYLAWTAWTDTGATFTLSCTAGTPDKKINVNILFFP